MTLLRALKMLDYSRYFDVKVSKLYFFQIAEIHRKRTSEERAKVQIILDVFQQN